MIWSLSPPQSRLTIRSLCPLTVRPPSFEDKILPQADHPFFDSQKKARPPFPSGAKTYDPGIAWWMVECSRLAYKDKCKVAHELENAGFDRVTFFDTRSTYGYLAQHPGQNQRFAVLAFRGTVYDFTNIITDIEITKRKIPETEFWAHAGFIRSLLEVWGNEITYDGQINVRWEGARGLSNAINELAPDVPLYGTGHSLGGALATLAAFRFKD